MGVVAVLAEGCEGVADAAFGVLRNHSYPAAQVLKAFVGQMLASLAASDLGAPAEVALVSVVYLDVPCSVYVAAVNVADAAAVAADHVVAVGGLAEAPGLVAAAVLAAVVVPAAAAAVVVVASASSFASAGLSKPLRT